MKTILGGAVGQAHAKATAAALAIRVVHTVCCPARARLLPPPHQQPRIDLELVLAGFGEDEGVSSAVLLAWHHALPPRELLLVQAPHCLEIVPHNLGRPA